MVQKPSEGKDPQEDEEQEDKVAVWAKWIARIFVYGFLLGFLATCGDVVCSGSHDDTWGHLDHQVKTDPFFKQWD